MPSTGSAPELTLREGRRRGIKGGNWFAAQVSQMQVQFSLDWALALEMLRMVAGVAADEIPGVSRLSFREERGEGF